MRKGNPKSTVSPKVHRLNFGMIHCLFRYSTDAGTSSFLWSFNPLLLRLLGEISPSLPCSHSSRVQLWIWPASACRSPEGVCSLPRQDGVKVAADLGLWLPQARESEGYRMRGEPAASEAS